MGYFFLEVGPLGLVQRRLAFRRVSHTALGYGDVVLPKPWGDAGVIGVPWLLH